MGANAPALPFHLFEIGLFIPVWFAVAEIRNSINSRCRHRVTQGDSIRHADNRGRVHSPAQFRQDWGIRLKATPNSIDHYSERIELGLFSRDEMTWAFEFAGMAVQYDAEGLMGRGLYIGTHNPAFGSDIAKAEIADRGAC